MMQTYVMHCLIGHLPSEVLKTQVDEFKKIADSVRSHTREPKAKTKAKVKKPLP